MNVKRHLRMTPKDKIRKIIRQRERRKLIPSVNKSTRNLFDSPRDYHLTYEKLFVLQAGCCKICNKHQEQFNHTLHLDHDHGTLEIRGLLCYSCNSKLGFVEKYLDSILSYLGYERI